MIMVTVVRNIYRGQSGEALSIKVGGGPYSNHLFFQQLLKLPDFYDSCNIFRSCTEQRSSLHALN